MLAEGSEPTEVEHSEEAGRYAKADLSSGLVSELDELQGVVGGLYAAREGRHADVCHAIATHYDADLNPTPSTAAARIGLRLTLADQLDKLAGYLGLGMMPSGSSDPYGLRRAAGIVLEIALRWPEADLQLDDWLRRALASYTTSLDHDAALRNAEEVFRQRYVTLFDDVPADWLEATFAADTRLVFAPHRVAARLEILRPLATDVPFLQAAIRPLNITAAAEKKGIAPVPLQVSDLDSIEGQALLAALESASYLPSLVGPINAFFDATMVMVEDERVRDARLALLRVVGDKLREVADFSKIVIAG
jgi:glycyl-tRNA synthetase beta chain